MGKVYTIYLTTECNFQCTYCYEEYTKCLILDKEMLKDISEGEGDLTRKLPVHSRDEVGEMALYFNYF